MRLALSHGTPLLLDHAGLKLLLPAIRSPFFLAELQGVAAPGPVDDVGWDLQDHKNATNPPYVVANLLREEVGLSPGLAKDLLHGEVSARMVEQELEELKLSGNQFGLTTLMVNHSPSRIQPQAMEVPDPSRPQLQASLIALHLCLDDLQVRLRRPLSDRLQLDQVAPDPIEDSPLELDEVGIDAHPMARVFPVGGSNVLTLQRRRGVVVHCDEMWHPD